MTLQQRCSASDSEVRRLTKSVKVVEVEVQEDNKPLRSEISRLEELNEELTIKLESYEIRINELLVIQSEYSNDDGKLKGELSLAEDRIRTLELQIEEWDIKYKTSESDLTIQRDLVL